MVFDLFFVVLLILIAIEDSRTRTIPNYYPLSIFILSFLDSPAWRVAISGILMGLLFLIIAALSKNQLGGGDVKLIAALGAYLGIIGATFSVVIGLAAAVAMEILVKRNLKESFPLGPYLSVSSILVVVVKATIIKLN